MYWRRGCASRQKLLHRVIFSKGHSFPSFIFSQGFGGTVLSDQLCLNQEEISWKTAPPGGRREKCHRELSQERVICTHKRGACPVRLLLGRWSTVDLQSISSVNIHVQYKICVPLLNKQLHTSSAKAAGTGELLFLLSTKIWFPTAHHSFAVKLSMTATCL